MTGFLLVYSTTAFYGLVLAIGGLSYLFTDLIPSLF